MAKVIHIKDAPPDFKENPNCIYIGRANMKNSLPASKWANPFRAADAPITMRLESERKAWAINAYAAHIMMSPELHKDLPELDNKTLICYCKTTPDVRCHGDVLVNWRNMLFNLRVKWHVAHPLYQPKTILICGSRRPVSPAMRDTAHQLVLDAFLRGDRIIVGDAPGIDAIVTEWAERLYVPYRVYGVQPQARAVQTENYIALAAAELSKMGEAEAYTLRDRYMVSQAEVVYAVWNGKSEGTKAVADWAKSQKRETHLLIPDRKTQRQLAI